MLVVGLTGGIASGKSTIATMLRNAKVPVIDADELAREVTRKGSVGYSEIVHTFGGQILTKDQDIDRKRLANMVFGDDAALKKLEAIVHPKIADRLMMALQELEANGHKIAVYMAPLIFEKQLHQKLDKTILVVARKDLRIQRLLSRDGLSKQEIEQRFKVQLSDEDKSRLADEIIENNGAIDELYNNLCAAWRRLTGNKLSNS